MNLSPRLQALRAASGRLPVSVIITTLNEEVNIRECLESAAWADEILLVDSFRTLAIARSSRRCRSFSSASTSARRRRIGRWTACSTNGC